MSSQRWAKKLESLTLTLYSRILANPWIVWDPHPVTGERGPTRKQTLFLLSEQEEILYGGSVRGGKSYALMAASVMYHDMPGHNTIIFRKNRDDLLLPDGPYDVAQRWDWTGKGAHYDGSRYRYTFPSGKTVTFGYVGESGSEAYKRYKSAWFQDIFFDQVEEIDFKQYDWMRNRLGRLLSNQHVPLRFWSTANPDGKAWVYEHFVKPETRAPETVFIPATADDNPWVDLEALEETLSRIKDPITYKQLREGIWGLSGSGGMFDPQRFKLAQRLPTGEPLIGVRYWDLAATSEREGGAPAYSCGVRMHRNTETNQVYVDSVVRGRLGPSEVEDMLRRTAMLDRKHAQDSGLRLATVIEQEPGASGKAIMDHYLRRVLAGYEAYGDKVTDPKRIRAGPWAAAVQNGYVTLVIGEGEGSALWIDPYRNEHRAFPEGEYKDQCDASSGAFSKLNEAARAPKIRHV